MEISEEGQGASNVGPVVDLSNASCSKTPSETPVPSANAMGPALNGANSLSIWTRFQLENKSQSTLGTPQCMQLDANMRPLLAPPLKLPPEIAAVVSPKSVLSRSFSTAKAEKAVSPTSVLHGSFSPSSGEGSLNSSDEDDKSVASSESEEEPWPREGSFMAFGNASKKAEPEPEDQQTPETEQNGGSSEGIEQKEPDGIASAKGIIRLMPEVCVAGTSFEESIAALSAIAAAETEAPEENGTEAEESLLGAEPETPKRNGTTHEAVPTVTSVRRSSSLKPKEGEEEGKLKKATRKGRSLSPWRRSGEKDKPTSGKEQGLVNVEEARAAARKVAAAVGPAMLMRARRPALTPLKIPDRPAGSSDESNGSTPNKTPSTATSNALSQGLDADGKPRTAEELIANYMALQHSNLLKRVKAKAKAALAAKDKEIRDLRERLSSQESPKAPSGIVPGKSDGPEGATESDGAATSAAVERLRILLAKSRAEVAFKTERLAAAERNVGALEDGLLLSGCRIADLQERVELAQDDTHVVATSMGVKLRQREADLEAAEAERSELVRQVADLEGEIREALKENDDLLARAAELADENEKLKKAAEGESAREKAAENARARASTERDEMAAELEAMAAIADVVQRALASTGARARNLECELKMVRAHGGPVREEVGVLRAKLGETDRDLAAAQEKLVEREKDVAALKRDLMKEKKAAACLRAKVKEAEASLAKERARQRDADEAARLPPTLAHSVTAHVDPLFDGTSSQKNTDDVSGALQEKESEAQRLAREVVAANKRVGKLRQQLDAARAAEEAAHAAAHAKDEERVKLLTEKDRETERVLTEKDEETVKLLTELEKSHATIVEMGAELHAAEEQREREVRALTSELAKVTSELAAARATLAEAEGDLESARWEAAVVATEKEKKIKRLSEELVQSLEALQRLAGEREELARERNALRAETKRSGEAENREAEVFAEELEAAQVALEKAREACELLWAALPEAQPRERKVGKLGEAKDFRKAREHKPGKGKPAETRGQSCQELSEVRDSKAGLPEKAEIERRCGGGASNGRMTWSRREDGEHGAERSGPERSGPSRRCWWVAQARELLARVAAKAWGPVTLPANRAERRDVSGWFGVESA
ncbi:hypothetical protein KFL_000900180 [Klebsormidium nitens]|uniref:Uncharacterized protein n=1 Tax=Klebsormidium nitens TaxID=105231 RepID=A0A0U9HSA1_KLENI|nr:hypothetical protein KFL_000900180 [Klebsormidium nitens]|eukprot:GAQ81763.1 hypothetical protein KFL_000900180 [Klebsormidium nitens]